MTIQSYLGIQILLKVNRGQTIERGFPVGSCLNTLFNPVLQSVYYVVGISYYRSVDKMMITLLFTRFYRAEPDAAQNTLQFQPVQYNYQSPGYQQQQLQPLSYYQQQQLQPQVLYQQQQQPQQLRSLQGFADPRFQQDYKHRLTYADQENPPPRPAQASITPQQQQLPSPFQFQPPQPQQPFAQVQQFVPQPFGSQPQQYAQQPQPFEPQSQQQLFTPASVPQQYTATPQQFSPQSFTPAPPQFTPSPQLSGPQHIAPQPQRYVPQPHRFAAEPQPFASQQEYPPDSKLGVSYSSAGVVSRTVFNGLGASYSF